MEPEHLAQPPTRPGKGEPQRTTPAKGAVEAMLASQRRRVRGALPFFDGLAAAALAAKKCDCEEESTSTVAQASGP